MLKKCFFRTLPLLLGKIIEDFHEINCVCEILARNKAGVSSSSEKQPFP
jgi:hypothetical protein